MNRLNVFLANSNGNLNKVEKLIKEAVIDAESYVFPKLGINWNIDLMITNHMTFVLIPEDGVGGRTYWSDLITVCVNEEKMTKPKLTELLIHELCLAAIWCKNE